MDIELYPKGNEEIKKSLRIQGGARDEYALAYIEHLEAENQRLKDALGTAQIGLT